MKLNSDEIEDLELMEKLNAEARRVYDPIAKVFDHSKKRVTDLAENSKVSLPKPCDQLTESSIELMRQKVMETFREYKKKNCNKRGEQATNLSKSELKGLTKLRKRIAEKAIVVLKTDKSGKLTVIERDKYEKLGKDKNKTDEIIDRRKLRQIESRINAQTKFWTKILNSGKDHGHQDRILQSKQSESQNCAPKYFMYKDHKVEGGWRPVVGGCNSDTLGLSNTLSELVESVCMSIESPYEVISSEDMLSRISVCNERIRELGKSRIKGTQSWSAEKLENWDWRQDYILIGTDVSALFPSLSAKNTANSVKKQIWKSKIAWNNIDNKWLTLYLKLNAENLVPEDLNSVKCFLPNRLSNKGKAPSFGATKIEENYVWPQNVEYLTPAMKSKMLGIAMEQAITFFFTHFTYTFGGKVYLQKGGGPIGARLTMAVARLVMQDWKEAYNNILVNSDIIELLSGLYVDDGRGVQRLLKIGERFVKSENAFKVLEDCKNDDIRGNRGREDITRVEVLKAMNSINEDLSFTMELCGDFSDLRLPTLSFSMWQDEECIKHSYFEKSMRNQTLLLERTSMSRQSLFSILSNELTRRMEVLDERLEKSEIIAVIDKFVQQLVNSEFSWTQCREIVISSLVGYNRKEKRRKLAGKPKYRSGVDSLEARVQKKLTEKYNWFR